MENEEIENEIDGATEDVITEDVITEGGAAVKKRRVSGGKITLIVIASLLAALMLAVGLFFGIGACTGKRGDVSTLKEGFTTRKVAPTDGSLPSDHSGIDNIAYMAYVLDNQPFYHAYAKNSTKSAGVEQITQTWKDYKSAAVNGTANNVMVCTDLSYSTLAKSSTQSCFVGDNIAYVRSGAKPKKNSTPSDIEWNGSQPDYYTLETYLKKYGEFSTELTVYVLNDETVASWDEVVDNGNGTYSQKFCLNNDAVCWYQYKMKTNGSLKYLPEFEKIEITFTFDSKWQILESYCEEKATISPVALGGNSLGSTGKTTTTFDYSEGGLDNAHYSYFEKYYEKYVGQDLSQGPSGPTNGHSPLDVIGEGFSKVTAPNGDGQTFTLGLTIGQTEYIGKAYAKLGNLDDILGSLNIRLALEKKGSGKQDLFIEFVNGAIEVYYSDSFALTANIDEVADAVTAFSEWINSLGIVGVNDVLSTLAEAEDEETGGLDFGSLLTAIEMTETDNSVTIAIKSDNLLGLGIGVDVQMNFDCFKDEDGDSHAFRNFSLSGLSYNKTPIDLAVSLVPDESSEKFEREKSETYANLADYINGIRGLLESKTYVIDINLDGGKSEIEYIKDLTLSAKAHVKQENGFNKISVNVPITVTFNKVSIELEAYYTIDGVTDGTYGEVYLFVKKVNGNDKDFKVYCNISEAVDAVREIIGMFTPEGASTLSDEEVHQADTVANVINTVLNLDFGAIITDLKADKDKLGVTLNVDKILDVLKVDLKDLDIAFGELYLTVNGTDNTTIGASLSKLGFTVTLSGSDTDLTEPVKNDYLSALDFIATVKQAIDEAQKIIAAEDILFALNNLDLTVDGVKMSVAGSGEVIWKDSDIIFAADLILTVSEKRNGETVADVITVKFVYDGTAEEDEPFVRFAVNELGFEIYQSDLESVQDLIEKIKNVIGSLTGNGDADAAAFLADGELESGEPESGEPASGLSIDYVEIITTVLKLAGKVTVDLRDSGTTAASLKNIFIAYAQNVELLLGANGGLSLDLKINNNNSTEILGFNASVNAGNGDKLNEINTALDGYTFKQAETFLKEVYDYVFDLLENVTVGNMLGSNTYTVEVTLDGNTSGIKELEGITVTANLYYTDKNVSNGKKLIQAELNITVNETVVKANVYYTDKTVYVTLNEIGGTVLSDIAFKSSVENIYNVAETLVGIITSEEIVEILSSLLGDKFDPIDFGKSSNANGSAEISLTKVINYLLTFDLDSVIKFEKVDGKNTLTLKPDSILEAFGVENVKVGNIKIEVNPVTHSIYASVEAEKGEWLILNAQSVEGSPHATFTPDSTFIDISFVPDLLQDVVATLKNFVDEDNNINVIYSLTGTITAEINYSVVSGTIKFENTVLTVGLDENNELYLSLTATLKDSKAKLIGVNTLNITSAGSISVTYSHGYLTLGRDGVYKVMTLDYLLDNALADSDISPVKWLLGTNGTVWSLVVSNLGLSLSSGLTEPQEIGLYELASAAKESSAFSLSSYISGFETNVNGIKTNHNTCNAVSEIRKNKNLGLSGNYYAFDINAAGLTGGVLSTLYAAILSGEDGICGIKAMTNIGGALDLSVNLASRAETHAPDYFMEVTANHEIDFNYSQSAEGHRTNVFGCYDTSDGYSYTPVLDTVTLKVIDFNNKTTEYTLRYGSTVYLTNLFAPEWTNGDKEYTVIYKDLEGNEVGEPYTDSEKNVLGRKLVLDDSLFTEVEGEMQYTLVIVKAEGSAPEKEIAFHIKGIDGIEEVKAAFAVNDGLVSLIKYRLDGYIMLGWYLDENYSQEITADIANAFAGDEVYCEYLKETVTVNGVIYKLYEENGKLVYHVNSFDAGSIGLYSNGKPLVLESEIALDGVTYTVTAIDDNALKGANVKNVVVPDSITLVGKNAFSDNYGIQSVVFLAQNVKLQGTKGDKTYPFYGCSDTDGGDTTSLKVYYTNIDAGNDWSHFRHTGTIITTDYYIQSSGGALVSENWAYVEYSLNRFATELTELKNEAVTTAYDKEYLESYILSLLNNLTRSNGYINAYSVEVSCGFGLNNSRYAITVTITDLPESEWWYAFTVQSEVAECSVSYTIPEELYTVLNGVTFVKAGTEINLVSTGDEFGIFEFDGWTGADAFGDASACETILIMPVSKTDITATWSADFAENIYVTSEVKFYYNGVEYDAGADVNITNAAIDTKLASPVAVGNYAFLGWAVENADGTLTFVSGVITDAEAHYYAVWAANHLEDLDYTAVTAEGNAPVNPDTNTGYTGTFFKWYKDAEFTQAIETFTTSDTILYARMQYGFALILAGNDSVFSVSGEFSDSETVGTYTLSFDVLEGEEVSIRFEEQIGDYKPLIGSAKTYYWNNCIVTYNYDTVISAYKKGNDNNANRRTFTINEVVRGADTEYVQITTGQNITISDIRSNVTVNGTY